MAAPQFDHGEFKYTLRQYLLMRKLNRGGDWTDVLREVNEELWRNPEWDAEALNTYDNWRAWYDLNRERVAS